MRLVAEPTNIIAFAEKALGWMLEDKQRELLTGPSSRVILNCTRQWGKSWMAAVALLFHAVHQPESLSIVAGPTLRQNAELLKKLKDLALRLGMKSQGDGINRQSLVLPNRSRIVAVPGNSPDGIRGFSGVSMLVIDEASMVKEAIYIAARPCSPRKTAPSGCYPRPGSKTDSTTVNSPKAPRIGVA